MCVFNVHLSHILKLRAPIRLMPEAGIANTESNAIAVPIESLDVPAARRVKPNSGNPVRAKIVSATFFSALQ
jgi:hypothetical protein